MKYNSPGCQKIEFQYTDKMPGDSLSFPVLIRSDPDILRIRCRFAQLANNFCLFLRNLIIGLEIILNIYTQILLRQVSDMSETRHHTEIFSQELLYSFRFSWRLNNYKIFDHYCRYLFFFSDDKVNPVSYTHLRANETRNELVCRLL